MRKKTVRFKYENLRINKLFSNGKGATCQYLFVGIYRCWANVNFYELLFGVLVAFLGLNQGILRSRVETNPFEPGRTL